MKKCFLFILLILLASCSSQKKYTDFDISYSKSGGLSPIYENMLFKGKTVHYSLEGQGKKTKKDFTITDEERKKIEDAITKNNFKTIQENSKKIFDKESISINIKYGKNQGIKTNANEINTKDAQRWNTIVQAFQSLIHSKVNNFTEK